MVLAVVLGLDQPNSGVWTRGNNLSFDQTTDLARSTP